LHGERELTVMPAAAGTAYLAFVKTYQLIESIAYHQPGAPNGREIGPDGPGTEGHEEEQKSKHDDQCVVRLD
jgi:hypothetical protein